MDKLKLELQPEQSGRVPDSEFLENLFDLLRVYGQRAVGPDDEVGAGDFLVNRPLGVEALLDLLRRPAPRAQPFLLCCSGTGDTNDFIETGFSLRFKKQWNNHDGERAIFPAPCFDLREPAFADARVQNGFKFFPGVGVGENDLRQLITAQPAIGRDNAFAENGLDFHQGGPAGLDELPRQFVRVHDLRAEGLKKTGCRGFAHAHAAGRTADFHRLKI